MDEMIKTRKLKKREAEILRALSKDDGTDLVYNKGGGWWIGNDQTTGTVANSLIRHCAITLEDFGNDDYRSYRINETGMHILETGYMHVHAKINEYFSKLD